MRLCRYVVCGLGALVELGSWLRSSARAGIRYILGLISAPSSAAACRYERFWFCLWRSGKPISSFVRTVTTMLPLLFPLVGPTSECCSRAIFFVDGPWPTSARCKIIVLKSAVAVNCSRKPRRTCTCYWVRYGPVGLQRYSPFPLEMSMLWLRFSSIVSGLSSLYSPSSPLYWELRGRCLLAGS